MFLLLCPLLPFPLDWSLSPPVILLSNFVSFFPPSNLLLIFSLIFLSCLLLSSFPLLSCFRSSVGLGHGCYCLAVLRSVPVATYVVLVTVLRYHLFIWSVFSPKLLYEALHTVITAGLCLLFTTMEQRHPSRA